MLGRGRGELPEVLEDELRGPVPLGEMLRPETTGVLPSVLRRGLHRTQVLGLPGQ